MLYVNGVTSNNPPVQLKNEPPLLFGFFIDDHGPCPRVSSVRGR